LVSENEKTVAATIRTRRFRRWFPNRSQGHRRLSLDDATVAEMKKPLRPRLARDVSGVCSPTAAGATGVFTTFDDATANDMIQRAKGKGKPGKLSESRKAVASVLQESGGMPGKGNPSEYPGADEGVIRL